MSPHPRAKPLPREDRQKAILDAVIPLLIDRGPRVTTAEMALAAGIAEGTIFRVFRDKPTLLHQAVRASFDPGTDVESIAAIPQDAPLEEKVSRAALVLQGRFDRIHSLMTVARSISRPGAKKDGMAAARKANRVIVDSLTDLFESSRAQLRVPPRRLASLLNTFSFALHLPFTRAEDRVSIDEAVAAILEGVRARESESPT